MLHCLLVPAAGTFFTTLTTNRLLVFSSVVVHAAPESIDSSRSPAPSWGCSLEEERAVRLNHNHRHQHREWTINRHPPHHLYRANHHQSRNGAVSRRLNHNRPRAISNPLAISPTPPSWHNSPAGNSPPPPYQAFQDPRNNYPPIIVNQHYYLGQPPPSSVCPTNTSSYGSGTLSKFRMEPMVDLADGMIPGTSALVHQVFDDGLPRWHGQATQLLNQGAAMYDQIFSKFNNVMTMIDSDKYFGNEKDLFTYQPQPSASSPPGEPAAVPAPAATSRGVQVVPKKHGNSSSKDPSKGHTAAAATSLLSSGGYFAKVELYANSRLPMNLPPLKLYMPTYPLLCLAAQYSEKVYEKPQGFERDTHVDADWRTGTKAMRLKSVPMDHMNTIVFAIRGTATFMDWAVNLNTAPTSPLGFLDDPGNFCHAGFLSAARKMVKPVAARLRQLLEEQPNRASHSLLITGHSAGGAVAALLYSHMLATSRSAASELNFLTGCFKRVHCVTFGAPPVSLLPLAKPEGRPELKKSLFLAFVNEGDPVARADKAYIKSLLELFSAPVPNDGTSKSSSGRKGSASSVSSSHCSTPELPKRPGASGKPPKEKKSESTSALPKTSKTSLIKASYTALVPTTKTSTSSSKKSKSSSSTSAPPKPTWHVPPSTLSNAGRLVVLRSGDPHARLKGRKTVHERLDEGVVAQTVTDEQLRGVVWGDPVCHMMKLYAGRIETLAVGAVTVKGY
ncbi:vegetative cell wall protein gp1 [Apiospora aurea]|uniref:Vegetative cell wall protein gp1 n=1 Tax=Apiospora aurea TaxID=335848 RepID=A0ABR1QUS1_9PEZI